MHNCSFMDGRLPCRWHRGCLASCGVLKYQNQKNLQKNKPRSSFDDLRSFKVSTARRVRGRGRVEKDFDAALAGVASKEPLLCPYWIGCDHLWKDCKWPWRFHRQGGKESCEITVRSASTWAGLQRNASASCQTGPEAHCLWAAGGGGATHPGRGKSWHFKILEFCLNHTHTPQK